MQKALDQMNLQLHHVISDLGGKTGWLIVEAILAGERDPHQLAKLRDPRTHASEETIASHWWATIAASILFTLRQSLTGFRQNSQLIADCDLEIELLLKEFAPGDDPARARCRAAVATQAQAAAQRDDFDLRTQLHRIFAVD